MYTLVGVFLGVMKIQNIWAMDGYLFPKKKFFVVVGKKMVSYSFPFFVLNEEDIIRCQYGEENKGFSNRFSFVPWKGNEEGVRSFLLLQRHEYGLFWKIFFRFDSSMTFSDLRAEVNMENTFSLGIVAFPWKGDDNPIEFVLSPESTMDTKTEPFVLEWQRIPDIRLFPTAIEYITNPVVGVSIDVRF